MSAPALLDDGQVQSFLRDGYVVIDADQPAELHARLHGRICDVLASDGNPGNDILPRVPELHQVLDSPKVAGALTSLLGPDYLLHPHRHCHLNPAASQGQRMHQDSYEADQNVRHHRVRWLMAFYYPQDVDANRGPSSVVPATQYLTAEDQHDSPAELPLVGAAGTVTIVHYDVWHRATANVGPLDRFMVKFLFTRMTEPTGPTWDHNDGATWGTSGAAADAVGAHVWNWLRGAPGNGHRDAADDAPDTLARGLEDAAEINRLAAAYRLGSLGAVPILVDALRAEGHRRVPANLERAHTNPAQLDAARGLTASGSAAVPALIELLADEDWWLRASAADILGDIGLQATEAVVPLAADLTDPSSWVRRNATEALGNIGPGASGACSALGDRLRDADEAVRHNAALALAKIGGGEASVLEAATADDNRYVRELAAEALRRSEERQTRCERESEHG